MGTAKVVLWILNVYGQDLLCTVNVQHDCATYQCTATGTVQVRQERILTGQTKAAVVHQRPTEGFVLNIAQMRDALHLRRYRPTAPELISDDVVMMGVAKEVNIQKSNRAELLQPSAEEMPEIINSATDAQRSYSTGRGARKVSRGRRGALGGQMSRGGRGGTSVVHSGRGGTSTTGSNLRSHLSDPV